MFALLLPITLWHYSVSAADKPIEEDKPSEETVVDQVHRTMSTRLTDFMGQVDGFFSKNESLSTVNDSWLRIRLQAAYLEDEDLEPKGNIKLKLVLPSTEKKLRLLLSTDEDDTRQSESFENNAATAESSDGDVAFALRFLKKAVDNNSLKFDLGAKIRDRKALAFVRVGGFSRNQVSKNWWGTLTNNTIFYSNSEYDIQIAAQFDRNTDSKKKVQFSSTTQFTWERSFKGVQIQEVAGFYRNYGARTTLALEALLTVATAPRTGQKRFRGGVLRFRMRQNAFREWFYYELWPSINWSAENNYKAAFGMMVRAEVVIGNYGK